MEQLEDGKTPLWPIRSSPMAWEAYDSLWEIPARWFGSTSVAPTLGSCGEQRVPDSPGPAVCALSVPWGQTVTRPCSSLLGWKPHCMVRAGAGMCARGLCSLGEGGMGTEEQTAGSERFCLWGGDAASNRHFSISRLFSNGVVLFPGKCVHGLPVFAFTSALIFGFSSSLPLLIFTLWWYACVMLSQPFLAKARQTKFFLSQH